MKNIIIEDASHALICEKLKKPFGFKGRHIDELWQSVCAVKSAKHTAVCPATQSVLWSDAAVFAEHSPDESNELMYKTAKQALSLIKGRSFTTPDLLINSILPSLREYADYICKRKVKTTFLLNSLVGIDFALWSLYAKENGIASFDGIIPGYAKDALGCRHDKLAHIPLISYNVNENELKEALDAGTGLLKIKIGNSVDKSSHDADMKAMVEWDKARLAEIHRLAQRYETDLTKSGKVCYYLDANGRYDTKDRLWELIDYMDKNNILSSTAIIEEPFDEENEISVHDLPVTLNADESAHSEEDLKKRISLGYRSVALKPIAKTLSVSFRMAEAMKKAGGQYLCADLTVNPLLAEWNKQFASRIAPLSAMNTGCVEVNGDQNYSTWENQIKLLPEGMEYHGVTNGCFVCDNGFYEKSGLLFGKNGYFNFTVI
ncbi:MAG: hypothetical protein PHW77_04050 [Eubacteriales bacterium]|nr:hypothetical protein [Eubacteriales bacterium]